MGEEFAVYAFKDKHFRLKIGYCAGCLAFNPKACKFSIYRHIPKPGQKIEYEMSQECPLVLIKKEG